MKRIILYPFVFALFPVISLYQANADQLGYSRTLDTLALVVLGTGALLGLLYLIYRNFMKAAVMASLIMFMFFSFGHFLSLIMYVAAYNQHYDDARSLTETLTAQLGWLSFGVFLVLLFGFWLYWRKREPSSLSHLFSNLSIALIGSLLVTGFLPLFMDKTSLQVKWVFDREKGKQLLPLETQLTTAALQDLPDIYYIILDGYGRQDVLHSIYNIDNRPFIDFLEDSGFYVARQASTNYMQTHLSISSSMNLSYLDSVAQALGERSANLTPLAGLIENGYAFQQLRKQGYQIINFSNGFSFTDIRTADQVFGPVITPDGFQMVLMNNTPLSVFLMGRQYSWHRERILYALDHLPDVAGFPGPTFVFAHILAPHPPFVFGSQGEPIYPQRKYSISDGSDFFIVGDRGEYLQGYRNQLQYITRRIQITIEKILEQSPEPPIIILQSDHGPGSSFHFGSVDQTNLYERGSILNAYYLPGDGKALLYPQISPVNSFRIVFNAYLGTQYQLLEDRSYYSSHKYPLLFIDVTNQVEDANVIGEP